jgi:hypothetical protein
MVEAKQRIRQIDAAGYRLVDTFVLSDQAWRDYYQPLKQRAEELQGVMPDSRALQDIRHEVSLYEKHLGEFGYQVFIIQLA